ncbi:MAG TPA: chromosomal replication initiator protein DnaA [Roseiarcus sp.]|jgi:chromosomal replication initiator protein|nr:chromosomal replication initiator protein DnaA [Roseiarcus sp.]
MDMYAEPTTNSIGLGDLAVPSLAQSWRRCCERLRAELGEDIFNSWFGRIELEEVNGAQARLSVPTRFLKSWIDTHYLGQIGAALGAEVGALARILVSVRSSMRPEPQTKADHFAPATSSKAIREPAGERERSPQAPQRAAARAASPAANEVFVGSPLDRRLTFATFQVGRSNQLAFSAAQRAVEQRICGRTSSFCPLYVHSTVGLGKTHLLQAMAHAATSQGRSAIYLTAEKFMYGFVASLQAQTSIAFKERLRAIDLLIFDDAQFLQGKTIQAEFGHTLDALLDAGREVIVAADRPPNDLEALDDRVRSRLGAGLCVEIGPLDEPLRLKILEARVAAARSLQPNFEVSPAVLAFVARSIRSNGRDLEGAVNRLLAHSTLTSAPLSVEAAEVAIRDLIRAHEIKRVKIEDIQKLVASHYSVSRADILSSRRTAVVVKPRQVAMFLAKTLTMRSLPEIGRRFGGRDHTTVLHAVRKIETLSANDATLRDEIDLLKRMLQE